MKKILAVLITMIMLFSLGFPAALADGGAVYWLNFKPELDETLQSLAAKYTESTGVAVKIVTAASGSYNSTLLNEMGKSGAPTLFVIGNAEGVREWGEFAMDLTGTPIAEELTTDAYNLYDEEGRLVSIGYCYECYGIVVNPENVEKAGHSMDELVNFEGLKAVAEDIHANAEALGFDAFASADMDSSSSWRYTGHLINLEYFYEKKADGWKDMPATLTGDYVDNFRALYSLIVNNSITDPKDLATGGHDAAEEFMSGKVTFYLTGSWDYATLAARVPGAKMIPYYCGVEGEEKAGLNCGTENCWAINKDASDADKQATMDFMMWLVSDPEASATIVEQLGVIPYKHAAESTNGFLSDAANYTANGCYVMEWVSQPNVDAYRAALVSALNQFDADQTDANWELVRTAIVDGWATNYAAANE